MEETLLDTVEEMVTDKVTEEVSDMTAVVEDPYFETMMEEIEDILRHYYTKGVLHTSVAIGAGFSVFKLLKNRKRIKKNISTFVEKNKEALNEVKKQSDTPEVIEAEVVESE